MARFRVVFEMEGARTEAVRNKLARLLGPDSDVVKKVALLGKVESRADRLQDARQSVEDATSDVEQLQQEMQDWYDSIPENLQQGEKANQVEEAANALETLHDELDNIDWDSVEFPGMF